MTIEKTYEMAPDAPAPVEWEQYARELGSRWSALLDASPSEAEVQAFLERHPSLLPGHRPIFGMIGHHGPHPPAVISQPPLQGLGKRVPDFMWLTRDTGHLSPVLIEIEDPKKKWLTAAGHASQPFIQALNQLHEWEAWFSRRENEAMFVEHYDVPTLHRRRKFVPTYVLIYGRKGEDPELIAQQRDAYGAPNRLLLTFDHLAPDERARNFMCATKNGSRYVAKTIPPTMRVGPVFAHEHAEITGKVEAVAASPDLPTERGSFLRERFSYWDEWSRNGSQHSSEWE